MRRLWLACVVATLALTAASCKKKPPADLGEGGLADAAADAGADGAAAPSNGGVDPDSGAPEAPPFVPSPAPVNAPLTFRAGDTWTGAYVCKDGPASLELRIATGGSFVSGLLKFTIIKTKVSGSFKVSGTFEPRTTRLRLKAGEWVAHPKGGVTIGLDGKLSADGKTYTGSVSGGTGCRTFGVSRPR